MISAERRSLCVCECARARCFSNECQCKSTLVTVLMSALAAFDDGEHDGSIVHCECAITWAAAAFAVVRAIAIAEAAAERYFVADTAPPLLNTVGEVALLSAQSVVMFGAAAIALEVCIAKGYITPFRASFSRRA